VARKTPVKVEWRGLEELVDTLSLAPHNIAEAETAGLSYWCKVFEKGARDLAPVRTGYLRSTIYSQLSSAHQAEAGATAPYAGFVEYGTRRRNVRPFIRPAVEEATRHVTQVMGRLLKRKLR
jgi:HK97 gp10 family phage protein